MGLTSSNSCCEGLINAKTSDYIKCEMRIFEDRIYKVPMPIRYKFNFTHKETTKQEINIYTNVVLINDIEFFTINKLGMTNKMSIKSNITYYKLIVDPDSLMYLFLGSDMSPLHLILLKSYNGFWSSHMYRSNDAQRIFDPLNKDGIVVYHENRVIKFATELIIYYGDIIIMKLIYERMKTEYEQEFISICNNTLVHLPNVIVDIVVVYLRHK